MIKNSFSAVGIFGSKALLPVKEGLTTDRPGIKGPGKESELGRLLKYYFSKFPLELGNQLIVCWYQLKMEYPQPSHEVKGQRSRS